jgi:hypothetical protein
MAKRRMPPLPIVTLEGVEQLGVRRRAGGPRRVVESPLAYWLSRSE